MSTPTTPAPNEAAAPAEKPDAAANPATAQVTQTLKSEEKTFTQADVDRLVASRLQEEEDRRTQEAERLRQEAVQAEAVKRGEFETVITTLKGEKTSLGEQLAAAEGRASTLQKVVDAQLDRSLADLPEEVRGLAPKRDDLDAFQTWLAGAQSLALKLQQAAAAPRGNPPAPPPSGVSRRENREAIKASLRRSGRY